MDQVLSFSPDDLQGAAEAIVKTDLGMRLTNDQATTAAIAVLDYLVHRSENGPWPAVISRCSNIVANAQNPDFPAPTLEHDDLLKALGHVVYEAITTPRPSHEAMRQAIQTALDEGRAER